MLPLSRFYINKYVLYAIVLVGVVVGVLHTKISQYFHYAKTEGEVTNYYYHHYWVGKKLKTQAYPIIVFYTKEYKVTFTSQYNTPTELDYGDKVPVLYNPNHAEEAYQLGFWAYWGMPGVLLIPFAIIWSAIMLGINFIPTKLTFKKAAMLFRIGKTGEG